MRGKILLILFFCLFSPVACFASNVSIEAEANAFVNGRNVVLGDIAHMTGNESRIDQLAKAVIATAARPGASIVLTKEIISNRLIASGIGIGDIEWNLPETITVTTNSQLVPGETFSNLVIASIRKQLAARPDVEYVIETQHVPEKFVLPVGEIAYKVYFPHGIKMKMPTNANVAVTIDGNVYETEPVHAEIHRFEPVIVATSSIPQHTQITLEMLAIKKMETTNLQDYYRDINQVAGLNAKQTIQPGTVLTGMSITKPIVIKRGSYVMITAQIGSIAVSSLGTAMQDGAVGQRIKVKNQATSRLLQAEVLDSMTVRAVSINGK